MMKQVRDKQDILKQNRKYDEIEWRQVRNAETQQKI